MAKTNDEESATYSSVISTLGFELTPAPKKEERPSPMYRLFSALSFKTSVKKGPLVSPEEEGATYSEVISTLGFEIDNDVPKTKATAVPQKKKGPKKKKIDGSLTRLFSAVSFKTIPKKDVPASVEKKDEGATYSEVMSTLGFETPTASDAPAKEKGDGPMYRLFSTLNFNKSAKNVSIVEEKDGGATYSEVISTLGFETPAASAAPAKEKSDGPMYRLFSTLSFKTSAKKVPAKEEETNENALYSGVATTLGFETPAATTKEPSIKPISRKSSPTSPQPKEKGNFWTAIKQRTCCA
mmetsp:Transcript_28198/g.37603  ORF Transcript_28198/g.37603 Transcript_28198/m.37603 type:complete len:297 (-) Transcript_28198:485-1375(-)